MLFNPLRGFNLPYYFLFQLKKDKIRQAYLGTFLRDFAMSLTGIFEPIYLFLFFRDFTSLPPLSAVAIWYSIFFLLAAVVCPLGARLASRIGFRRVALLSMPFRFGYYVSLILLPHMPFLLFPAFISLVIATTLYWPGFHFFVVHSSKHETRATSVGLMNIAGFLASAAGPAIGGIIIMMLGYPILFILVIIFLLASVVPFWFSMDISEKYSDSLVLALRCVFQRRTWRQTLAFFAAGIEDQANGIVWPLFLFLIALNYSFLGFLISISLIITLVVSYAVGKVSDRAGWKKVMNVGIILHIFAWASRIFVATPRAAFAAHSFYGFSRAVATVPFSAIFYDNVANANGQSYCAVVLREQALDLGRMLFLIGVALFFLYSQNFHPIFLFVALTTSCMWFLRPARSIR